MSLPSRMLKPSSLLIAIASLATAAPIAAAQDPFEIQVYEYATVPGGRWNLETHFNYTGRGTRTVPVFLAHLTVLSRGVQSMGIPARGHRQTTGEPGS